MSVATGLLAWRVIIKYAAMIEKEQKKQKKSEIQPIHEVYKNAEKPQAQHSRGA